MADTGQPGPGALAEVAHIADVIVDVEAILDRSTLLVRELLSLARGSVIPLARPAGENVDIYVNDVLLGHGEIVTMEDALAVRITNFAAED